MKLHFNWLKNLNGTNSSATSDNSNKSTVEAPGGWSM